MRVWLSEKDSQARDLAAILGSSRKVGKYTYQTAQGLVTAARGHLYTDLNPREYNPDWGFNILALPFLPDPWKQKPRSDQGERIAEIQRALRQASEVVIATDAGAEGERIARNLLTNGRYRGPIKRLWLKALDPASIQKALAKIVDGSASEGLYEASIARSKSDWLVGMNLTVLYTLVNQALYPDSPRSDQNKFPTLQTGRVKTPTAKLVVDRDRQIETFVPRQFFHLEGTLYSDGENTQVILKYHPPEKERIFDPRVVLAAAPKLVKQVAQLEIHTEEKKEPPKLPYDLLELQKACNRLWAWTAEHTLQIAQSLYDTHKIISYPRTDSRYLPEEQIPEIAEILSNTYTVFDGPKIRAAVERDGQPIIRNRLYSTAKVGEHNAIVPTTKRPDPAQLNPDEHQLYLLTLCRYLENLSPDYEYSKTTVTLPLYADEQVYPFKAARAIPLKNGWKDVAPALTGQSQPAQTTPGNQTEGDNPPDPHESNTRFPPLRPRSPSWLDPIKVLHQTTQPPPHFTEATLLEAMRRIHEYEPDPVNRQLLKDKEIPGIGTPATRSKILEELKEQNYLLLRKRKELHATPKAKQMVRVMASHFPDFVSISTTSLWQQKIQQMEKGHVNHHALVDEVFSAIDKYVRHHRQSIAARIPLTTPASGSTPGSPTQPVAGLNASPIPTGIFHQKSQFFDYGTHWRCQAVPGYFNKTVAKRAMELSEYIEILNAKSKGVPFQFISCKNQRPYMARLVYRAKTKYNGKPGIDMQFD